MRLIGIALLAFIMVGVAFLLTERRAEVFAAVPMLSGTDRIETRFNLSNAPALADFDEDLPRVRIAGEDADRWSALSGVPSYATIRFNLPRDTNALAGELVLNLRTDIAEGTEGEFRINLNGQRRALITIRPGRDKYRLTLPLTASDLVRDQLVVSMAMRGDTASAMCTADEGYGALVEVEGSSALHLVMEEALQSFSDRLLAAGEPAQLFWPVEDRAAQANALAVAVGGQTVGHDVQFVRADQADDAAIDPTSYDGSFPAVAPTAVPLNWPIAASEIGGNDRAVTFQRSVDWTLEVARSALPERTVPTSLDLNLRPQQLEAAARWFLNVEHDGMIVYQDRFAADGQDYRALIPLGEVADDEVLRYRIQLQADWQGQGPCLIRPELTAQMLPSTTLIGGQVAPDSDMEPLFAVLGRMPTVGVELWGEIDVTTANAAVALVEGLITSASVIEADMSHDILLSIATAQEAVELAGSIPEPAWVRGFFTPGEPAQTLPLDAHTVAMLRQPDGPRTVVVISLGAGS